jgi:hypothetical protein
MEIYRGPQPNRWRSPAESRTVAQFLLAVNTGRKAVFINLNKDLAIYVEPFFPNTKNGRKMSSAFRTIRSRLDRVFENEGTREPVTIIPDYPVFDDELSTALTKMIMGK